MAEDALMSLLTLIVSGSAVYVMYRITHRRLLKAAKRRAIATAEALVADTYQLIEDLYDTPTRAGHP